MPGKLWKPQEEQLLRKLWESGVHDTALLATKIKRSEGSIREKLKRMSLRVVVDKKKTRTTTRVHLGKKLLTHEEALKILAGALKVLRRPGHDKLELQRLRILVNALQTYDSVLEKFEGWVEFEDRLLEMEKKVEELQKAQKVSP